jgi:hypothetical protein
MIDSFLQVFVIVSPQLNCASLAVDVSGIGWRTILVAFLVPVIAIPHIPFDLLAFLVRLFDYSIVMSISVDVTKRIVEAVLILVQRLRAKDIGIGQSLLLWIATAKHVQFARPTFVERRPLEVAIG